MFSYLNSIRSSSLVSRIIIPNQRANLSKSEIEKHEQGAEIVRYNLNGEHFFTTTQDNAPVKGTFFPGINTETKHPLLKSEPTVVIFCGLGNYAYFSSDLIRKYQNRGFNVAIFNYRGIDNDFQPTSEGMISDGLSVVDYLHHHHGVAFNKLTVHGFSLGGGPSSAVAASRPGLGAVNERSYSSLSYCASNFINTMVNPIPVVNVVVPKISGVSKVILKSVGWNFDTDSNWAKITGKKCVVFHPNDDVIGREGSLFKAIFGKDLTTTFVEMDSKINGHPHLRLFEDVEIDAIVKAIDTRVSATALNVIQQNAVIRPILNSLKDRIIKLLTDIFYVILYPLGFYQLIRDLCKCR